ncbi:MAG TPA: cation:dicarboxylase symporter family transporter, partial [Methylocystis sp.]|nr:cation:dicarboxylase symporter family transporter [Methylocystis sp.]
MTANTSLRKPLHRQLYAQVLAAIVLGALFGAVLPQYADQDAVRALGEGFIRLVRMTIAPIIFCTVASGVAHIDDAKKVGRVGVKALVYFEVVSTLALVIGLVVGELLQPGAGFPGRPDAAAIATYAQKAHEERGFVEFLLDLIPDTVVGAFARGDILQVLLFALLFGFSLMAAGERVARLRGFIDDAGQAMFGVIAIVMKLAPLGAFGAMAYTVGHYGLESLRSLAWLVGAFYLSSFLFVILVLGLVARYAGFSIWRFLRYIKEELLIVLGSSSSEAALPPLMEKLQRLGCAESVVGLVVPTGYSFNLDGTNIYMTLATVFIAQALGIELTLLQKLTIIGVAMLTSKGASG